jgi:hypothetical protein
MRFGFVVSEKRANGPKFTKDSFEPLVGEGDQLPVEAYLSHHEDVILFLDNV